MLAPEIDVGRTIAGKYELVKLLGKGAMGEVWLATHDTLGGEFAIKLVKPSDEPEDETAAGRFQLEAQVSAKLSRKTRHIVSVSDHGEEDGLAYLVMELLDGESLEARIKRQGQLDLPTTVGIVTQVARALTQAHAEGIFHRDLKPANVFLSKDEDGRLLVKLLDFGIARTQKPFRTRSPFMTGKDMVLGTPSYMSPEQARGLDTLDYRCDLWALAVVAYESLTKRIPWEGETVEDIFLSICTHRMVAIATLRQDLGPAVEAIFARSFAPKLDERFKSAQELADAFEATVDPAAVDAAMGPLLPSSSRRMLASSNADARRSDPALFVAPAPPSSRRGMGYGEPATSDPAGFTVGDNGTVRMKKRGTPGWLLAAIAALITITVVGLGFIALRGRGKNDVAANPPLAPTTPTTNDHASVPPPPASVETTSAIPTTTATTTQAPTPTTATPTKTGTRPTAPRNTGGVAITSPATAVAPPPVTAVAPPTPPPATAPPTPPAPTKKPLDKGEVF